MKKLALTLFLAVCSFGAFAQITLEHYYPDHSTGIFKFSNGQTGYHSFDNVLNQLKIYSQAHALLKTIHIPAISGYQILTISVVSDKVLNSDAAIEYGVSYLAGTTIPSYKFVIYNESGVTLLSPATGFYGGYFYSTSTGTKLVVYKATGSGTEIYSVPGVLPLKSKDENEFDFEPAYPNPANNRISLPHGLKPHESGTMRIFDISGREINRFNIDGTFSDLIFEPVLLPNGIYIYQVESEGKAGRREKFVIQK